MLKDKVEQLINDFLSQRNDLFLYELKISTRNNIEIYIDGDELVTLQDCLDLSRAVEFNLDREEEDFSLEVSSPGLSAPFKFIRQYNKHIGREFEILTISGEILKGELKKVTEDSIELFWIEKRNKEVGKGKEKIEVNKILNINEIKKANIVLKF